MVNRCSIKRRHEVGEWKKVCEVILKFQVLKRKPGDKCKVQTIPERKFILSWKSKYHLN